MSDMVKCPNCKGSRQMMKLGGIFGNCSICNGVGDIKRCDLPKPVEIVPVEPVAQILQQVAESVPTTRIEHKHDEVVTPIENDIKVDGKRAIFKRKTNIK